VVRVWLAGYWHRPSEHVFPPVQAYSQRPQLLLSCRFVHTHDPMPDPGHLKSPEGQAQAAPVQMAFELQ